MGDGLEHIGKSGDTRRLDLSLEVECSERVNFALQQYGAPLVHRVAISNLGDCAVGPLTVTIAVENGDAGLWSTRVERIDAGSTYGLEPEGPALSAGKLASRTEAERSAIVVSVEETGAVPGTGIVRRLPVDLLAFDQWPGSAVYPEILAAFITPNHPRVADLLTLARESLGRLSGHDALDGYQAGSRQRAALIAESCFNAAHAGGFGYINPPANFDREGQRVRLLDRVCRERMGSCLDLSLLLAGLWEQTGLHAMVILVEGHAMPAVWTHEAHLPEPAIDDDATVRNLVELGEVLPVESTHLTQTGATFAGAVDAAKRRLASPGPSFCAVDVAASRKRGVRPLPLRTSGTEEGIDLEAIAGAGAVAQAGTSLERVALADRAENRPGGGVPAETDRIAKWQSKLLDLTLLNRLVNFRETGRTLRLRVPKLAMLEDMLADEETFSLRSGGEDREEFLLESVRTGYLYSSEPEGETQKRLLTLYRSAKSAIEETGANLLYLALGMLRWYETPTSTVVRRAPLILLPVRLERKAAAAGYRYVLSLADEPLRPNVTLLEKLRLDFGVSTRELLEMPEDEHGLDVDLILRNFRSAIRGMARWEIEETAYLGLFSFNKFLMWRDLCENLDRLKQNRLVKHLVDRGSSAFDPAPLPGPDDLDDSVKPGELLCTRDADSTQLAAIRAASQKRTFVLEGPPGTGKSQTITNIIADSIGRGRRVLFVAEKQAALSVVRSRLEKDGLGRFCLELHSAKASKKEVISQLEESLGMERPAPPPGWDRRCAELAETRARLNAYVRAMHRTRASGETLHHVLGRLVRLGDGPRVKIATEAIDRISEGQLADWRKLTDSLRKTLEQVGPVHQHALRGIGRSEWSFGLLQECRAVLDKAQRGAAGVGDSVRRLFEALSVAPGMQPGWHGIEGLVAGADVLRGDQPVNAKLIAGPDAADREARLRELCTIGKERDARRTTLLARYRDEFLSEDHLGHLDRVNRAAALPALFRPIGSLLARRGLRKFCRDAKAPSLETLRADLGSATEVRKSSEALARDTVAMETLGAAWNGGNADWARIEVTLEASARLRDALQAIVSQPHGTEMARALATACLDLGRREALRERAEGVVSAWGTWRAAWAALDGLLKPTADAFADTAAPWVESVQRVLERWAGGLADLSEWCEWRRARNAASEDGLGELVAEIERGAVGAGMVSDAFERSFGERWFNEVANSETAVREFTGPGRRRTIEEFRALDKQVIESTRWVIGARLSEGLPSPSTPSSPQSELGILRREIQKKRGHLPTRRLVESIPTLMSKLKPCFLMSPLSVAQYLDAKLPPFDLVIFDEASQIPAWDAVGAIARGAEVIVVGDSKQLPPTNFFKAVDAEDESDGEFDEHAPIEEVESILKECNASGIPDMWLGWHYRSRHESLIAFSNHHYYQNRLNTFPSPEDRSAELGVTFRHVADGVYDKGGSRTNRVEARRVVDEVVRMLSAGKPDSIGIVTFNQSQQHLIEDLLDERRREHPVIDRFFTAEVDEPVFVKNLENVQGDERDTILFSVGYGPDQAGRVGMNFGPLNQDGGERRLNVAVTRARKRLIVYSSLRADQIDLRRTRAVGVRHFKTFLDYADRGPKAIAEAITTSGHGDCESEFEDSVCAALRARGWSVDAQVGCAHYRIDLAIRDPERPGRYVLGIECDGAMYHSGKTARDRDRLRQSVLESLGWRIERVWSTEWRVNPDRSLKQLEDAIHAVLNGHENGSARSPAVPVEPAPTASLVAPPERGARATPSKLDPQAENGRSQSAEQSVAPRAFARYRCAKRPRGLNRCDLLDPADEARVAEAIVHVVREEGPIVKELLLRRIAPWCGVQRITDRARERFDRALATVAAFERVNPRGDTLWPPMQNEIGYVGFRVPGADDDSVRDLEHVPLCERVNAVEHVIREQFGLPRDGLEREVGLLFGVQRLSAGTRELIGEAIEAAKSAGRITEREDRLTAAGA